MNDTGAAEGDALLDIKGIVSDLRSYSLEREWFEFKVNWLQPTQLSEYISALSNSAVLAGRRSAYFVWGVENETHAVVGTRFDADRDVNGEPLKHFLARQFSPEIAFEFDEGTVEGERIVVLAIPAAKIAPTSFSNERFIRIGSSKENLRKYPERKSQLFDVLRHGIPSIENTPSAYQDLTFAKLLVYYATRGLELKPGTFEKNLGLRTQNGQYNILAQLLADDSHMPVRVAIFSGKTKADKLSSVREFGNQCLLYSLDDVLRYGDVLNIIQADERNRVVERKEVSLFEDAAFREAIVNAFLHNAWVTLDEPMVSVFSDRIEILSRGTLAPGQTMEGFFAGESVPVNRKLSEIFLQLHISEKTGRGVPKITEEYGRGAFEFRENSIVVTIPFNWVNAVGDKPGDKVGDKASSDARLEVLSKTQVRVLVEIRDDPNATKPVIANRVGVGKTTVDNAIAALKKHGLIERVGSNKTGWWRVIETQKDDLE